MTIKEIQNIIKEFEKSTLMHLELETKDVKIKLSKQKQNEIIEEKIDKNQHTKASGHADDKNKLNKEDQTYIKSPLVGTFYMQSTPNAKPFVQVGQKVKKGQVVCIIEAMKIMNEITSPYTGVVKSIEVHNKDVIGYDQVLMTIGEVVEK
ncbi:acetyl-CoA carboxylase biotin carboxyl carrier protein [Mariniplasma anaerobium]|uniref:Biotin carboxyl carrier protein of acetyl-CoA carboxylase n=1 Tax=Mariniplasma anaerobium TaxID=2735436 RepID=A0A7U9TIV7_9MOLU|nr:acetyl-CoA carboxylase biotin carboxyl carrier protein [Mariniplasma anaerobium]BCR36306.1 acetyl-CoA carboxylase, biotin carboxyl carrier protein [Mariniplasma anaerobium]